MVVEIIVCLVIGYVFGCFQTGYFYGRLHGIDIRKYGSGNVGTTNTLRTLGKKAGYITYLGDALKAIFAILLVRYVVYPGSPDNLLLTMYTGFGVVLGHNYPFYLKFKGGKGIAVTSGVMVAFDVRFAIPGAIGFFLAFFLTRYVSVGSLVLAVLFPICVLIFYPGQWHLFIVSLVFCAMAFWRHRSNIVRLANGTENRFDKKKKKG
ncbi:MAG: glycerol-3-phosphate 1-O-acyltransferase PlsY [Clostridiales bacterium]|nr:glycerol-3-phosphate 1-O-acyltransferase PlsY [Clostridiales bacterium]